MERRRKEKIGGGVKKTTTTDCSTFFVFVGVENESGVKEGGCDTQRVSLRAERDPPV